MSASSRLSSRSISKSICASTTWRLIGFGVVDLASAMLAVLSRVRLGPVRKLALSPGLLLWYHNLMKKASSGTTTPRWRRAAEAGTQVQVRLQSDDLAAVDAWAAKQKEPHTRPEAIRTLLRKALKR